MRILALDPGESTGWCLGDITTGDVVGGTCPKDHRSVIELLERSYPTVVVMERFNLYPQMAKSLAWNSFYPCEVIGVIRWYCLKHEITLIEQAPSIKKYAGGFKEDWDLLKSKCETTEHTKDAYLHYRYYLRNGLKSFQAKK